MRITANAVASAVEAAWASLVVRAGTRPGVSKPSTYTRLRWKDKLSSRPFASGSHPVFARYEANSYPYMDSSERDWGNVRQTYERPTGELSTRVHSRRGSYDPRWPAARSAHPKGTLFITAWAARCRPDRRERGRVQSDRRIDHEHVGVPCDVLHAGPRSKVLFRDRPPAATNGDPLADVTIDTPTSGATKRQG